MLTGPLTLTILPETFAICHLGPQEPIPGWATVGPFLSITRTPDELSIVCPSAQVPEKTQSDRGWHGLQVQGPLDFALTGILASLAGPLAQDEISLFAISTFDTDYILVKELERAVAALSQAGHRVIRENGSSAQNEERPNGH